MDVSFDDLPDTMVVNYYISNFLYESLKLIIETKEQDSLNANLEEHCCILNLKVYKFLYPIRNKDRIQIFYHLEGIDDFGKKNIFTDTIDFTRKKSLSNRKKHG